MQVVVVLAPIGLIGYMGALYVVDCLNTLAAPGVPLAVRYKAQSGNEVVVTADAYTFDWRSGHVWFQRPRLIGTDGSIVAQLDALEISNIDLRWGANQVVRVRARNLQASLVRLPTGRFQIEDLLPKQTGQPSTIPFSFTLDRARVLLTDRESPTPWRQMALVTSLRVDGLGDDWLATAGADLTGVGSVTARIQAMAKAGIHVSGQTQGLELARLLEHVRNTRDKRAFGQLVDAQFSSLIVKGPFAVYLPSGKDAVVETRVSAIAKDASFGEYHADEATFDGLVSANGATGKAHAIEGPVRGWYDGSVSWRKQFVVAGRLAAWAPNRRSLPTWARKLVPAYVRFEDAKLDGWLSVVDGKPSADGSLVAQRFQVRNEAFVRPETQVHVDESTATVRLLRAHYLGQATAGVVAYDIRTGTIDGALNSTRVSLAPIAARFPQARGLSGDAVLSLDVAGTAARPIIRFEARGAARYAASGRPLILADQFDVAGVYRDGLVAVTRGFVQGPGGLVTASGKVSPTGSLDLNVIGRGLDLGLADSRFGGTANLRGSVRGTFSNPLALGRLEVYNTSLQGQGVTAATADFRATRQLVRLENVDAYRGAAHVTGVAQLGLANQAIHAAFSAQNVQLQDFLGDAYAGSLDARDVRVGGTISNPTFSGIAQVRDVVARGVKIDSATLRADMKGDAILVHDSTAQVAGGTVSATGSYSVGRQSGDFDLEARAVDLNQLTPGAARYATLAGLANGSAHMVVRQNALRSAKGEGTIDNAAVNKTDMGSGLWTLGYDGKRLTGRLEVGNLDRYAVFSDLTFDPANSELGGHADLLRFGLQDLIGTVIPSVPSLSADAQYRLSQMTGQLIVSADFAGTVDQPRFDLKTLEIGDLAYSQMKLGQLSASVALADKKWNLRSLALTGPEGSIHANGTVDENGDTNVTADLSRLDLTALSEIDPRLAQIGGTVDVNVDASGPTRSPKIHATVSGDRLFAQNPKAPEDQTLRVMLDSIDIAASNGSAGGIDVSGNYFYRGFQGAITAHAPFAYPFKLAGDGKVDATVTLAQRDLKEIAGLVSGLDPKATSGNLEGSFHGSGTLENFSIDGSVDVNADQLAFASGGDLVKTIDTQLRNVQATASIKKNQVAVQLKADSSRGGSVDAQVSTDVDDIRHVADAMQGGATRRILDNVVSGKIVFDAFHGRQGFASNTYVDGAIGGTIDLTGTLQRPKLSGELLVSNLDSVFPPLQSTVGEGQRPTVDPVFDIRVALANAARLRTVAADLFLVGDGTLQGTLSQPALTAGLAVEKGTIRLPAATIRIDQGGTLDMSYQATRGDSVATLNVDLDGRTSVTAEGLEGYPERYDVLLTVRGDLLKENGLNLTASSDPPDLSQDRILALLGQLDLLTSIGTASSHDTQERLRSALLGYALPAVFDPFTSKIATALGLEYLTVEYNAFNETSLVFSKVLSREFYVTGSRQITPPPPGFALPYDFRLVYRPRRTRGILRLLSFSLGADQDRAWKLALEYGSKF